MSTALATTPPSRGLVVQGGRVYFSMADMHEMAAVCAQSKLFGVKTTEQALGLFLLAQAEGIHPMKAAMEYDIIDGKPSLKAKSKLARFIACGGTVKWLRRDDQCVAAEFSHPAGGSIIVDWDMARAQRAGLAGKPNWRTYPRAMMTARVITEGVDAVMPGVGQGLYIPEEIEDFDNSWNGSEPGRTDLDTRSKGAEIIEAEILPVGQPQQGITADQAMNVINEEGAKADAERAAAPGPSAQPAPPATPGAGPTENGEVQPPIPPPTLPLNELIFVDLTVVRANVRAAMYKAVDPVTGNAGHVIVAADAARQAFGDDYHQFNGPAQVQLSWSNLEGIGWIHTCNHITKRHMD